jgi:WD repeat-containing protein 19
MECLDIDLAIRVYRQLRDAGMVMALQKCLHLEEKTLLAGQIYMLFSDYQKAQELFLASSRPITALEMRRDLLHWEQALKLAQTLSTEHIPEISVQYGQQLEFRDEPDAALRMFDSALSITDDRGKALCPDSIATLANMGIARCNLRLGNIRQGLRLANEIDDRVLYEDCGDILEFQKQYSEAAAVYIKAGNYERAGHIYIKHLIKTDKARIAEAAEIMMKVSSDQLNSQYGKICVTVGRFEDAVKSFTRAKDLDKVVEIKLRNLDKAQEAFDLVRETSSAQGAQIVAEYCQETNDIRGAIEFFLIANKYDDAFRLAQQHGQMEIYTGILGDLISSEDSLKVAHYYEKLQDFGKAGKFYSFCGQYSRALKLFFQCGDREIESAIDVIARSQDDKMTDQLIDFLVGEKDGIPKDQNYLYKVYMARKKYEDAAKMASIIARQEQDLGNYRVAHQVIVDTIKQVLFSSLIFKVFIYLC